MMPSVSIGFPCWNRGDLLAVTLESIRRQNYPDLELIVLETGDDGKTKQVAERFGARYLTWPREEYPVFQHIAGMWNKCWREASGEVVILQCAEVLHESKYVIKDLVTRVLSGSKILATPLIKDLNQDGSFNGWYNHPREGSRPGWVSGAGPHAFKRTEMLEVGGYCELFFGYGHEDDAFFYMLRKNGWSIEYVESAICAHQWHERTNFEPVTGYANRSLIRLLTAEIEDGKRMPVAEQSLQPQESPTRNQILAIASEAEQKLPMTLTFKKWNEAWATGTMNVDDLFVWQRNIANEGGGKVSELGEMIVEAAWAIMRESESRSVALMASGAWAARVKKCADIHATWANYAMGKAMQLLGSI